MSRTDEQIPVSDRVKRELDRRRREGESYDDVLQRVLGSNDEADFYDGFGMLSDEQADRLRKQHEKGKEMSTERMRRLADEDA